MRELTVFGDNGPQGSRRTHPLSARPLRIRIRLTAVRHQRCVAVLLTAAEDQIAQCRIVSDVSGWDVRLEVGGRTVAVFHCTDWIHADRFCSMLASLWRAPHTDPPASR